MYNWSVDEKELKKDKEKYAIWRLEQMIDYGLGGERLDKKLVKKYWKKLFMDNLTRRYLHFLLWPQKLKFSPKSRKNS